MELVSPWQGWWKAHGVPMEHYYYHQYCLFYWPRYPMSLCSKKPLDYIYIRMTCQSSLPPKTCIYQIVTRPVYMQVIMYERPVSSPLVSCNFEDMTVILIDLRRERVIDWWLWWESDRQCQYRVVLFPAAVALLGGISAQEIIEWKILNEIMCETCLLP